MKQFTLNLSKDMQRPIVILKNWNNFRALLDTGAYLPIWTDDEKLLADLGGVCKKVGVPNGESNVRNLRIEDANGHLNVLCSSDEV